MWLNKQQALLYLRAHKLWHAASLIVLTVLCCLICSGAFIPLPWLAALGDLGIQVNAILALLLTAGCMVPLTQTINVFEQRSNKRWSMVDFAVQQVFLVFVALAALMDSAALLANTLLYLSLWLLLGTRYAATIASGLLLCFVFAQTIVVALIDRSHHHYLPLFWPNRWELVWVTYPLYLACFMLCISRLKRNAVYNNAAHN